jgi:type II secretory pathway pseudopilin PulG
MTAGNPARLGRHSAGRRARGFTYLGVLFLVALMGLGLSGVLQLWSVANQRAHERELLWVGDQYARALQSYYVQSPGPRQYPQRLDDLLEDRRFPMPRRHLRKLYADPVTRSTDWGLIKSPDGRIAGVHSQSTAEPWKKAEFPLRWKDFADRGSYAEWRFVANVGLLGDNKPAAGVAAPAAPKAERR